MRDLDTEEGNEVEVLAAKKFDQAVQLVKALPQKGSFQPSYAEAAKIYSFFKQAKFGPCNIPRPGFWDYINRAKWDAWTALGDLSKTQAMLNYVDEIKNIYIRGKELDEFKEREEEFAIVLIPFCQANNIQMSEKLIEIVKKQNKELSNGNNDCVKEDRQISENISKPANGNGFITDDASDTQTDQNQDHNHSILVENTLSNELKSVKFSMNNDINEEIEDADKLDDIELFKSNKELSSNENIETKSTSGENDDNEDNDEEEEVYCDTIDPESFTKFPDSINESSLITTDSGTHFEEKTSTSKMFTTRKRVNIVETSSDSHNECLQRELEKPYKPKSHKKKDKKPTFRNHGIRSNKRLDDQDDNPQSSNNGNHRNRNNHTTQRHSNITQSHHTLQHHQQRSNSNERSDSSENYSSSSSNSNYSIGIKIVNSLERMEDNMQAVLERLS